jgi:two-component system chemotaxis response regulator CheB
MPSRLIAIGVSADGHESLAAILRVLPADFPAAIVITLHRPRGGVSLLRNLLSRRTRLLVKDAAPDEPLRPGVVYLAPPDHHVIVDASRLQLSTTPPVHFSRPSIDVMFRSAAASWGARAIGIVLSGLGHDGAEALGAMREAGATVIVQDPRDAKFPTLPRHALAANHVHFTPKLDAIGPLLVRLVSTTPPPADDRPGSPDRLTRAAPR